MHINKFKVKIEEVKKQADAGVKPRTPLAWATNALPLSYDSWTTTNLTILYVSCTRGTDWLSHKPGSLLIVYTIHFCHNYLSTVYTASWQFLLLQIYTERVARNAEVMFYLPPGMLSMWGRTKSQVLHRRELNWPVYDYHCAWLHTKHIKVVNLELAVQALNNYGKYIYRTKFARV